MDTDVEVFQPFDSVLHHRCVLGFEYRNWVATSFIACEKNHSILKLFEKEYDGASFETEDGGVNMTTNVERLTALLEEMGLVRDNTYQVLPEGIAVFRRNISLPMIMATALWKNRKFHLRPSFLRDVAAMENKDEKAG